MKRFREKFFRKKSDSEPKNNNEKLVSRDEPPAEKTEPIELGFTFEFPKAMLKYTFGIYGLDLFLYHSPFFWNSEDLYIPKSLYFLAPVAIYFNRVYWQEILTKSFVPKTVYRGLIAFWAIVSYIWGGKHIVGCEKWPVFGAFSLSAIFLIQNVLQFFVHAFMAALGFSTASLTFCQGKWGQVGLTVGVHAFYSLVPTAFDAIEQLVFRVPLIYSLTMLFHRVFEDIESDFFRLTSESIVATTIILRYGASPSMSQKIIEIGEKAAAEDKLSKHQ